MTPTECALLLAFWGTLFRKRTDKNKIWLVPVVFYLIALTIIVINIFIKYSYDVEFVMIIIAIVIARELHQICNELKSR